MSLFVRESGPISAPTIVFLHGGGVSGWSWQPQIEAFPDYHLLVPDLPEHGRSLAEAPFTFPDAAARIADLIRDRGHGGRAHVIGLSLGAQTAIQLLAAAPDLVDHALLSGALVRGLPGASLVRPTIAAYMPFRNIPALVRANMRSSAIPADYYQPFSEDTRALTTDALTHTLVANMTFRLPAGVGSGEGGGTGDGWKQRIRPDVRLCTRCPRSHPRRARLCGQGRAAQLAAGRSWSVQLDSPRLDRGPRAAG